MSLSIPRAVAALVVLGGCVAAPTLAQAPSTDSGAETSPTPAQQLGVDRYALVGEPQGSPLEGDALEEATLEVSKLLRCPVCQGLSVADSPSPSALAMRIEVRELLSRGYTGPQISDYFESTYGEFVRLQPRARGLNWLVWLAPVVALGLGLLLVLRLAAAGREARAAEEPDLGEWRDKVRQEIGS